MVVQYTLMKAGPARSIDRTRKVYHHRVPLRSSLLSFLRDPNQITGKVVMTGTKMTTRCKKRKPVARGSQTYVSIAYQIPLKNLFNPCTLSGMLFCTSALDASSICSSGVFPSPLSSSLSFTNATGVRRAIVGLNPFGPRLGGARKKGLLEPEEKNINDARPWRASCWNPRAHLRPNRKAVLIVCWRTYCAISYFRLWRLRSVRRDAGKLEGCAYQPHFGMGSVIVAEEEPINQASMRASS